MNSNPPSSDTSRPAGKVERIVLVIASLCLIWTFFERLSPIDEMPSATLNSLSIILELAMAVGIGALGRRVLKTIPPGTSGRAGWIALIVIGGLAALGIFGIRLSGGPRIELPPRPGKAASESSFFPPELEKLGTQMGVVMSAYQKADTAVQNSRWSKTEPSEYRKLPRSALTEQIALQRDLVEATDRVIELLAEPNFEANFARMVSIVEARGTRLPNADLKPDALRLLHRMYAGGHRIFVLIDENWEEWRATPTIPEDGKPWQKEVLALVKDIRIADKEHDALLETRAAQESTPQATLNLQQAERGRIEAELKAAHASFKTRWDNVAETRWAQTENNDPREGQNSSFATVIAGAIPHLRKLSREDLSEFRKAQRTLLESYEQVFSLFQKAQSKGFDPLNPGVGLAGWYPNLATWQAAQRVHAIAYEQSGLIEDNWEDWLRSGPSSNGNQKPWQEKAQQLQSGFDSAFKEWQGLR